MTNNGEKNPMRAFMHEQIREEWIEKKMKNVQ